MREERSKSSVAAKSKEVSRPKTTAEIGSVVMDRCGRTEGAWMERGIWTLLENGVSINLRSVLCVCACVRMCEHEGEDEDVRT